MHICINRGRRSANNCAGHYPLDGLDVLIAVPCVAACLDMKDPENSLQATVLVVLLLVPGCRCDVCGVIMYVWMHVCPRVLYCSRRVN